MNQKGNSGIFALVIILIISVIVGSYYLVFVKNKSSQAGSIKQSIPEPTTISNTAFKTFSDPKIDVTFDYPSSFYFTDGLASDQNAMRKYPQLADHYKD